MKNRFIQIRNPRSGVWVLIDRLKGLIAGSDYFPFDGIRVRNLSQHYDDALDEPIGFKYGRQDSE